MKMSEGKSNLEAIAEALPIVAAYEDLLQPTAKVVGKNLETVARLITVALTPLRAVVWGSERLETWLVPALAERLEGVPAERIITPSPLIAGPALEALRFAGTEETLRELYANLLATSMDRDRAHNAHPSFVEILKQLSPDEAKILSVLKVARDMHQGIAAITIRETVDADDTYQERVRHISILGRLADCEHQDLVINYTENLHRLGIIIIHDDTVLADDSAYGELEEFEDVITTKQSIDNEDGRTASIHRESIEISEFGNQFLRACVMDRAADDAEAAIDAVE